jgi:hypothetical protein
MHSQRKRSRSVGPVSWSLYPCWVVYFFLEEICASSKSRSRNTHAPCKQPQHTASQCKSPVFDIKLTAKMKLSGKAETPMDAPMVTGNTSKLGANSTWLLHYLPRVCPKAWCGCRGDRQPPHPLCQVSTILQRQMDFPGGRIT